MGVPLTILEVSMNATITACVVWGFVEVLKQLARDAKAVGKEKPWYWGTVLRFLSLLIGGVCGALLEGFGSISDGWPWGAAIGVGAGALCTTIVAVVKARIKAQVGK